MQETHRLRRLLETFYRLNSSLELGVVLRQTLETATELMEAETGSIALVDDRLASLVFVESTDADAEKLKSFSVPLGEGIAGHVAASGETVRLEDVSRDPRFYDRIDQSMGSRTRSYLCVPLITSGKVIGTAQLMNRRDGRSFSENDEELLEGFARQAALAITNARLHEIALRQKAIDSELAICAEIQRHHFPATSPELESWEIYGASTPCHEVGGDYYTWLERPDGSWDLVLADVSGKGLAAAMTVADLHTGLRLLSPTDLTLDRMIQRLNDHLRETLLAGRFVTLFAARVRPGSPELEYVVAGHPPPAILSAGGKLRRLKRTGPILGVLDETYEARRETLEERDLLLAFTDGYSEAEDADGRLLGDGPLARVVIDHFDQALEEIHGGLDRLTSDFRCQRTASDDETLLLLRRRS